MKRLLILFFVSSLLFSFNAYSEENTVGIPENFWISYIQPNGKKAEIYIREFKDGQWKEPVQATDSSSYNMSPSIASGKDGSLWVAWCGFDNISTSVYAKRYLNGVWSEEYRVSIPDAYEDNQPCIDIDAGGNPSIAWAGNDGVDDEILFSSFDGANWSTEAAVNVPNRTPDIDPCLCATGEGTVILWLGFENGSDQLMASRKTAAGFESIDIDNSPYSSYKGKSLPSLICRESLELYFFSESRLYRSLLNKKTFAIEKSPEKISLGKSAEQALDKLPAETVENLVLSFQGTEKPNNTLNLYLLGSKKANAAPGAVSRLFRFFRNSGIALLAEKEALAVVAGRNTAFGDSITYGYGGTKGGYPPVLAAKLGQEVRNKGVPGEVTNAGADRIGSVLSQDDPQRILIMEGTNDVNIGRTGSTIKFHLNRMLNSAKAHGTTPVIATLTPNTRFPDQNRAANVEIRNLAAETATTLADMEQAFAGKDPAAYMNDYCHPNDAGYDIMANTWYNAISPASSSSDSGGGCGSTVPSGGAGSGLNLSLLMFLALYYFLRKLKAAGHKA